MIFILVAFSGSARLLYIITYLFTPGHVCTAGENQGQWSSGSVYTIYTCACTSWRFSLLYQLGKLSKRDGLAGCRTVLFLLLLLLLLLSWGAGGVRLD